MTMPIDTRGELEKLQRLLEEKETMLQRQESILAELQRRMDELQRKNAELDVAREQLMQAITQASLLSELTGEVSVGQDASRALERILSHVHLLLEVEKSSIMLLDEGTQELRIVAHRGLHPETVERFRLGVGKGIAGRAVATGKRQVVPDTSQDPDYIPSLTHPDVPKFLISVPFQVNGQVIGVLNVERPVHFPPPTAEQLRQLDEYANHAAVTIQNVRLYQDLTRRVQELSTLYEVGRELSSSLELDKLLRKIVDSATQLLDCEMCSLMLLEEDKQTLCIRYAKGICQEVVKRARVKVGEGIAGWVAKQGEPLLIEDIEKHPLFARKSQKKYRTKSLLSVPLKIRSEVIGVLNVNNKRSNAVFTSKDRDILMMLASQAAVAIENARLYEELERLAITDGLTQLYVPRYFHEELDKELRRAERYKRPLSLLMMDIDHFKKINDTYGHLQGDQVLRELAGLLKRCARQDDIVARYGGEEFAIALVETNKKGGLKAAERIRRTVEEFEFSGPAGPLPVTISIGVASYPQDATTKRDLIAKADMALLTAKERGRNRVVTYSAQVEEQWARRLPAQSARLSSPAETMPAEKSEG